MADLRQANISQATLERLADADAFRSIGLDRRQALWEISAMNDTPIGMFKDQPQPEYGEGQINLPLMSKAQHVVQDYVTTELSLKAHPLNFVRDKLRLKHILSSKELADAKDGSLVKVAGLVLVRQRPGTAGGVCFITIEDEFGFSNLVVFKNLFDKYRKEILGAKLLMVEGKLQREGAVTHVIVRQCFDLSALLTQDREINNATSIRPSGGDELNPYHAKNKRPQVRLNGQIEAFPKARNFK
jgi:error-prone DNA polymerase